MSTIGRALVILFGLCVAFAVGSMVFVAAMVLEPSFGQIVAFVAHAGFQAALETLFMAQTPDEVLPILFILWSILAVLLGGPPAFAALVGEVARIGTFVWYSGATALLTAALPWILRGGVGAASPAEVRVTLGLFLVGASSGFAYWLVAGRFAGRRAIKAVSEPVSPTP